MFLGPRINDLEIIALVPAEYRQLLEHTNGYVAYHGGLHVRGACIEPEWHSLRAAWVGEDALHRQFSELLPDDVPFAEDALGDQFVLRRGLVWKLKAECGDISNLNLSLPEFDAAVRADPDEFLELGPLHQFRSEGGTLEPGQLLSVVPPFVFSESADGVSLRAVPARQRISFLSKLAREIRDLPDGSSIRFVPES
jgi:hypothetical protein